MPAMYTQTVTVPLTNGPDSSGIVSGETTHQFPTNVIEAIGAVNNFTATYGFSSDDHHVRAVGADCEVITQRDSPTVTVKGSVRLVDGSGNKANREDCSITVAVMAWCV